MGFDVYRILGSFRSGWRTYALSVDRVSIQRDGAERATRASLQLEKAPLILLDLTGSNDNDSSQRQYGEAMLELHLWGTASFWEEKAIPVSLGEKVRAPGGAISALGDVRLKFVGKASPVASNLYMHMWNNRYSIRNASLNLCLMLQILYWLSRLMT